MAQLKGGTYVGGDLNVANDIYANIIRLNSNLCSGTSLLDSPTATVNFIDTGNAYSNGATGTNMKIYLHKGGSVATNYGFSVGSNSDNQYFVGAASGCHDFYANDVQIATIRCTLACFSGVICSNTCFAGSGAGLTGTANSLSIGGTSGGANYANTAYCLYDGNDGCFACIRYNVTYPRIEIVDAVGTEPIWVNRSSGMTYVNAPEFHIYAVGDFGNSDYICLCETSEGACGTGGVAVAYAVQSNFAYCAIQAYPSTNFTFTTNAMFSTGAARCLFLPTSSTTTYALCIQGQCYASSPSGTGGAVCIAAGCASSTSASSGGALYLCGGNGNGGSGTGTGGNVNICGGTGVNGTPVCGTVSIYSGPQLKLNTHAAGVCVTGTLNASTCICATTCVCSPTVVGTTMVCGGAVCVTGTVCAGTYVYVGCDIILTTGAGRSIYLPTVATTAYGICLLGQSLSTAGNGGAVSICGGNTNGGASSSNAGGAINIIGGLGCGTTTVSASCGGQINITGGFGCATSTGGVVIGGAVVICGGNACSSSYTGGAVYLCGGGVAACNGGSANLIGGCSTGGGGGNVTIMGGQGVTCGDVYIYNGSTAIAMCAMHGSCVALNYAASLKLATTNIGITVTGTGTATDWIATSDRRLKTNIIPISNALSMVMELQGVCYIMCDDCNFENRIGLIAQDVEKILPEVVAHGEPTEADAKFGITDDKLGLKYDKMVAVLIEAVKEQQMQINCLKDEINNLKNTNTN